MRITIIIHSLQGGGAERVTALLANAWNDRGHEVRVLSFDAHPSFYQISPNVQIKYLGLAKKSTHPLSAIRNNYLRIHTLRRHFKECKPDVVIGMMSSASILLAMAAFGLGLRTVGTERIYPPAQPLNNSWAVLRSIAYRFLDVVVCQTGDATDWIRRNTFARDVRTIPNPVSYPVPSTPPAVSPQSIIQNGRNIILAVGRLEHQKQFAHLIQAYATINNQHPDWDLIILGEGALRVSLEHLIGELRLSNRIRLPGRVGNVSDWYASAKIFVLCSKYEGFPNALAEAMASGVPAISYDCKTGPADLINPEVNGILVPVDDIDHLAYALRELIGNAKKRSCMAAEARKVRDKFSLTNILRAWDAIIITQTNKRNAL